MISKNRKNKIKKALNELTCNIELIEVYDQSIAKYEDLKKEQNNQLENWQLEELIEWKKRRLELFKKTDSLLAGINSLTNESDIKLYEVVNERYINKKSIIAIAHTMSFSEDRVKQLLNEAYYKLDNFIL
ncbi:hypothetical protein LJB88_02070 [Erysipelotrichaceae bacterium OttesenSCG-928-M19]|nr:hypothetical protein [Erysipelotrichaceae bacterium OttesenSCG-928-M19]